MASKKNLMVTGIAATALLIGGLGGSLIRTVTANAASTTDDSTTTATTTAATTPSPPEQHDPSKGGHTANGITETLLTGDTATKVTAAALAAYPGGTIQRVETDAEGATYEAHMTKADGTQITVKFDANYKVTGTDTGMGGGHGGAETAPTTSDTTSTTST